MTYVTDINLPTTLEEYDILVKTLCDQYAFQDARHVAGVISVAIRQLPNHESKTTLEHLAGWVKKSLANHIAAYKAELVKADGQVDALVAMIEKDPNDQQARDNLMLAAEHNEYAKQKWQAVEDALNGNPAVDALSDNNVEQS